MGLYRVGGGQITIFGHPINNWSLEALRRHIAYVDQNAYLFPGSIWENIAIVRPEAPDSDIQAAIDAALLGDLDIHREIGEQGHNLSGGQRQRVAIARAMLKDAPLILLDEPTSALDTESETMINRALHHLSQGRTLVTIAHRLSALQNAHRILCIEDGQIVESGIHPQLMELHGVYYELYKSQEEGSHEKFY